MTGKVLLEFDTTSKILNVKTDLPPVDTAMLLSQAITQCLMIEQEQRTLLINPLSGGVKKGS